MNMAPANAPGIEEGDDNGRPIGNLQLNPDDEKEQEAPANAPGIEEGDSEGGMSNLFLATKLSISPWRLCHRVALAGG